MYKYIVFLLLCFTLLSCRNKANNNIVSVILQNDNHIPNRQANEYFEKGLKYVEEENYGEAKQYFLKADHICPNLPVILNAVGNCYGAINFPDRGEPYFESALKADSNFVKTYANYGNCLNSMNEYGKATEILELGLARYSPYRIDRHMLLLNLAKSYYCQHDSTKALELLDSITADPHHDEVYDQVLDFKKRINKSR